MQPSGIARPGWPSHGCVLASRPPHLLPAGQAEAFPVSQPPPAAMSQFIAPALRAPCSPLAPTLTALCLALASAWPPQAAPQGAPAAPPPPSAAPAADATVLAPVTVKAAAERGASTEGRGSFAA